MEYAVNGNTGTRLINAPYSLTIISKNKEQINYTNQSAASKSEDSRGKACGGIFVEFYISSDWFKVTEHEE